MTTVALLFAGQFLVYEVEALPGVQRLAEELHWERSSFAVEEAIRMLIIGVMIGSLLGRVSYG